MTDYTEKVLSLWESYSAFDRAHFRELVARALKDAHNDGLEEAAVVAGKCTVPGGHGLAAAIRERKT